jgi:hypothetical protein
MRFIHFIEQHKPKKKNRSRGLCIAMYKSQKYKVFVEKSK